MPVRRSTSPRPRLPGLNVVTFIEHASYATAGQLGFSVAGGINILGDGAGDIILGAPERVGRPDQHHDARDPEHGRRLRDLGRRSLGQHANDRRFDAHSPLKRSIFAGCGLGRQGGLFGCRRRQRQRCHGNRRRSLDRCARSNLQRRARPISSTAARTWPACGRLSTGYRSSACQRHRGTGTGTRAGATSAGPTGAGSQTGFSVVAPGGDFNADGFGDILLGSPDSQRQYDLHQSGEVDLFYGAASTAAAS